MDTLFSRGRFSLASRKLTGVCYLCAFSILASPASGSTLFQLYAEYGYKGDNGERPLQESYESDNVESYSDLVSGANDFIDQLRMEMEFPDADQPFTADLQFIGLIMELETQEQENVDAGDYSAIVLRARCGTGDGDFTQIGFSSGKSQEENLERMVDYLEGDRQDEAGNLLAEGNLDLGACLVSGSPVDPVAGNPNSMVASVAQADYALGTELDLDRKAARGIGLGGSVVSAEGYDSWDVTLPINYVHSIPRADSRPILVIVDAPLRYVDLEDAQIVDGSLALGLRFPVLDNWALTPTLRAGVTGSEDTGSLQAVYSGNLTSHLAFYPMDGLLTLSVNNAVGCYQTESVDAGDYEMEYDTDNTIFRNGLGVSSRLPWVWLDQPTSWELEFVDTRIEGDDWYYDYYDEVVFSFGTLSRPDRMKWQDLRFGLKYTFAPDYDGFHAVMNYRF